MKTWYLTIRKEDFEIFENICRGVKTVETRAATKNFQEGDEVIFVYRGK